MHDYGSDAETTKQCDDKTCLLLETFLHGVIAWDALPMLIPTLMRRKKNLKTLIHRKRAHALDCHEINLTDACRTIVINSTDVGDEIA